ncbi:USP5 [Bugula neritina]|uniref:USP5 n=1 Tax=Bugula neritina TaxID=10212 RepID=A0A7J7KIW4_BUGNE|nr:USP5 [Bugula neritina]
MDKTLHEVLDSVRPPDPHKKVYKDECMYSFDSPDSETGLYICMKECYGFGKKFVEEYSRKSGNRVFLHLQRRHKIVVKSEEPVKKKPTKLAIDVEGGFDSNETKYTVEEHKSVVVLPEWKVLALSDEQMPPLVVVAVDDILALESATKGAELAAMSNTWEGDVLKPSKHALSLKQLDNGVKVPPSGWQCRYPGCNLTLICGST